MPNERRETREQLLEGAMRLLAESSRDHLRRVLTAGAVAKAAGLHRQTFYLYWSTQAEFVDDFVRYVTDPGHSPSSERLATIDEDLEDASDDPAAEVRRMSRRTYEHWAEDPVHFARMVLWATHPNDDLVRQRMEALYRANDEAAAKTFGAVGDAWGIEPRPPFTLDTIALLFNALRDGLMLQLMIRGDDAPASFFGDVHLAMSQAVTRPVGETDTPTLDEDYRRHVAGPDGAGPDGEPRV
ncbi:MAG: TetR/AcrR family transcriptional regulator [Acidimicrobiales bacterium]|nr:TetR/AcrR family transcriptional regulator [Acidimicrobiales bacterium]MCB9371959.1 TetR/AcrR family transcriptional regulator [Microthrixaceae bacterium]